MMRDLAGVRLDEVGLRVSVRRPPRLAVLDADISISDRAGPCSCSTLRTEVVHALSPRSSLLRASGCT